MNGLLRGEGADNVNVLSDWKQKKSMDEMGRKDGKLVCSCEESGF